MPFADPWSPPPAWAAGIAADLPPQGENDARAHRAEPDTQGDPRRTRRARRPGPDPQDDLRARRPGPDPQDDLRARGSEPDPVDWARQIVLRALTAAPRSRAQLEDLLRRKNCPDGVAEVVLNRLTEVGLVDDAAYADLLVRSRQAGRGLARRALAQELRRKGIDDDIARAALDSIDPTDEEERARELASKKMRSMAGLDSTVQTRRLAGMLARKGYNADLTMRVVREVVRAAPEHARD